MNCTSCGNPITETRLRAVPNATQCVMCLQSDGDVERTQGFMVWDHKTAPELYTGPHVSRLRQLDRRGFHAQLPLNSCSNARLAQSAGHLGGFEGLRDRNRQGDPEPTVEVARPSSPPSRCHPDRPRVNPLGLCFDCSVEWYAKHRR